MLCSSCLVFSVNLRTINRWTEDKRKEAKEKDAQEILELYLQCYSTREIATKLGVDHSTVARVLQNGQLSKMQQSENLQVYNVWNIGKLNSDQLKYPGQTPYDIVENIVYYYTDPPQKKASF